jgi:hypothetical protein
VRTRRISETNRTQLVLSGMQNRTFGPYLEQGRVACARVGWLAGEQRNADRQMENCAPTKDEDRQKFRNPRTDTRHVQAARGWHKLLGRTAVQDGKAHEGADAHRAVVGAAHRMSDAWWGKLGRQAHTRKTGLAADRACHQQLGR